MIDSPGLMKNSRMAINAISSELSRRVDLAQALALTALAGPVSNFLLALVLLVGARIMVGHAAYSALNQGILDFLVSTAVLSIGLGLFNLVPIPPLDGAKVLFSLLPDRMYDTMLRYERIGMFVLWGLVLLDVGSGALNSAIAWVFRIFCRIVGLS